MLYYESIQTLIFSSNALYLFGDGIRGLSKALFPDTVHTLFALLRFIKTPSDLSKR